MENIEVLYSNHSKALPPRPIRMAVPSWGGVAEKMEDGAHGQPWHCQPFSEASTYGLELVYPFETECQIVNENGAVRINWEFAREPGVFLTGGEFRLFTPQRSAKFYLFNTRMDIQAPAGHVLRTEPHPRYFTDDTGTVPLAMVGHLQTQWYPRMLFVVFRAPRPGQRHVFRHGEPFAQVLFVPDSITYNLRPMGHEEEARRRKLEHDIEFSKQEIADKWWVNSDGNRNNNHYKVLARAFGREGQAGVDAAVAKAVVEHDKLLPHDRSIPDCLALGEMYMRERKFELAEEIYKLVIKRDPNNADAISQLGVCITFQGNVAEGLGLIRRAAELDPLSAKYHIMLGDWYGAAGRFPEAEASLRRSVELDANNPNARTLLGLALAKQGRTSEGLECCGQALNIDANNPMTHFRMAQILSQEGRIREARVALEKVLALDPKFVPARQGLEQLPANSPR